MKISENNSKNINELTKASNFNQRQEKSAPQIRFSWVLLLIGSVCLLAVLGIALSILKPDVLKNLWGSIFNINNKTASVVLNNKDEEKAVRKEYTLYQQNILGKVFPAYQVSFDASKDYEISMNEDLQTEITIKDPNFELKILTYPEGNPFYGFWNNDEPEPETTSIITEFLGSLIRVEGDYFMTYHYTNGYEKTIDGGCKAYKEFTTVGVMACDTGQIVLKSGEENIAVVSVGCTIESPTNINFCDDIVKSLKVEKVEN